MRKKHPEHVNLERWLVSYADFITLLFAFFVIMYAISQADISKFKKVSASIKAAFSAAGPVGMIDLNGSSGGQTANPFETIEAPGGRTMNLPAGKTNTASDPDPEIQNIKELLEQTISMEVGVADVADKLSLMYDSRGLVLRLSAKDFFAKGDVDVRQDMQPVLDRIGRVLATTKKLVRVEGHTDASEANTPGYASDWELSAARAAWVVKYWVKRFGVDPSRFGAAGYGHYRPVTEKRDPFSQAKNRRVEIIILNNSYEPASQ
jgi:chemotaxis protein MotB